MKFDKIQNHLVDHAPVQAHGAPTKRRRLKGKNTVAVEPTAVLKKPAAAVAKKPATAVETKPAAADALTAAMIQNLNVT